MIKHINIKDFIVRARKKNKKRGRPSKQEIILSKFLSQQVNSPELQQEIEKAYLDMMLYGTGIIKTK